MRKPRMHVNAKLSGTGFMSSLIFLLLIPPLSASHPVSFVSFLSPYISSSSITHFHVLMSPLIFYHFLYVAFTFHPCHPSFYCLAYTAPTSSFLIYISYFSPSCLSFVPHLSI